MKRIVFLPIVVSCLILACNSQNKGGSEPAAAEDKTVANITEVANLLGSYVGSFGDNKIRILISKIAADTVEGRSVVGGNDRPFKGTVALADGIYTVLAKEPGDDKNDGVFSFKLDSKTPDVITGEWQPNDKAYNKKTYSLQRKSFEYRTDVGPFQEASARLLKEEDVNNLSKEELELMRNAIFARHGYCFKKKDLRATFELDDWYVPNTADVTGLLTAIEKKNITMIKQFEKYAVEYGDEFGR